MRQLIFLHNFVQNETLSEKEIKRLGFALSETRYNELLPILARLNELEQQQVTICTIYFLFFLFQYCLF